jgi:hypothetical protein
MDKIKMTARIAYHRLKWYFVMYEHEIIIVTGIVTIGTVISLAVGR